MDQPKNDCPNVDPCEVITMYVVPGVSDTIRAEDVIREEDETDEDYTARQALMVELWSIPDSAG